MCGACGGTHYEDIVPTKASCDCGRKMVDHTSNGLDYYIVCSGCLRDHCICKPLERAA